MDWPEILNSTQLKSTAICLNHEWLFGVVWNLQRNKKVRNSGGEYHWVTIVTMMMLIKMLMLMMMLFLAARPSCKEADLIDVRIDRSQSSRQLPESDDKNHHVISDVRERCKLFIILHHLSWHPLLRHQHPVLSTHEKRQQQNGTSDVTTIKQDWWYFVVAGI